jgi:hypothetical protein
MNNLLDTTVNLHLIIPPLIMCPLLSCAFKRSSHMKLTSPLADCCMPILDAVAAANHQQLKILIDLLSALILLP